jgi:hypothetical protein
MSWFPTMSGSQVFQLKYLSTHYNLEFIQLINLEARVLTLPVRQTG